MTAIMEKMLSAITMLRTAIGEGKEEIKKLSDQVAALTDKVAELQAVPQGEDPAAVAAAAAEVEALAKELHSSVFPPSSSTPL